MKKWLLVVAGSVAGLIVLALCALFVLSHRRGHGELHASIDIARPRPEVAQWFADSAKLTQWVSWLVEIRRDNTRPRGGGSTEVWVMDDPRRAEPLEISGIVVTLDSSGVLATFAVPGAFHGDYQYALSPAAGGGTHVDYSGHVVFENPIVALMEPLMMPLARTKQIGDMARLKEKVEQAPTTAANANGTTAPKR